MQTKSFVVGFYCFLLLFFAALSVNAQNTTSSRKEVMVQNKTEFKTKLLGIKNEKKRALVEQIDTKISSVNKKKTDQMFASLEKMTAFLNRFIEKVNREKDNGKDVSGIGDIITQAQSAIATSQAAVSSQAAESYDIQISTEEGALRASVGSIVNQFEQDLKDTRKTVVDAKQQLYSVVKSFKVTIISPTISVD